ncbi:hypothetical protein FD755_024636, partial [Muntiacus reevesi]
MSSKITGCFASCLFLLWYFIYPHDHLISCLLKVTGMFPQFPALYFACSSLPYFCSSSSSPSFQPIKSHVTIPTAHVIPSTLGTSPAKPNSAAGPSSKLPLSGLAESVGMTRNGDLCSMKRSPGLSRDFMYLCGAAGENGVEQSWFPAVGHEREEEARKFDVPNMESTLNQSAMLETLYSDPHYRVYFHNPRTDTNKELYKGLPETKKAPGSGAVCERNGPHPGTSGVLPLGLQPAPGLSKPLPSQVWQPNPDPWHSRERSCELSTCRQQLELIRLQMEQMQLQNGAVCHHPAGFSPSLPTLDPAQWISILNSNEHLLKEKELLIDKQRKHISQLEQKVRESELQVHSALLGRPAPFGDVCLLRLQELQRENTFLRAQFAQKTEALSKEKIELEKKLSASEVEVQLIRESLRVALQKHSEEGKKQEERARALVSCISPGLVICFTIDNIDAVLLKHPTLTFSHRVQKSMPRSRWQCLNRMRVVRPESLFYPCWGQECFWPLVSIQQILIDCLLSAKHSAVLYAPTSNAEEAEVERFYEDLQDLLELTPKKDFCQENTLVIANTLFQQHKRRFYTWTSPDGQHRNQIDYILCNQRYRSSIKSAKTRPGVDFKWALGSITTNKASGGD